MRTPKYRNEIERVVNAPWPAKCVLFSGKQQPNGYGRVSIDGKYMRAHVYSCSLAHGDCPPDKREVGHSCGNKMCINPAHLRWVTRIENEADKILHGRSLRCRGRVLTAGDVAEIRRRYELGGVTQQQLADEFGTALMTINDVLLRRTWRHAA